MDPGAFPSGAGVLADRGRVGRFQGSLRRAKAGDCIARNGTLRRSSATEAEKDAYYRTVPSTWSKKCRNVRPNSNDRMGYCSRHGHLPVHDRLPLTVMVQRLPRRTGNMIISMNWNKNNNYVLFARDKCNYTYLLYLIGSLRNWYDRQFPIHKFRIWIGLTLSIIFASAFLFVI